MELFDLLALQWVEDIKPLKTVICSYRPSYEVMLRFYSLYKQAVCGPCTVPRPGFWDPVGRYKWSVYCFGQWYFYENIKAIVML
uniref:ACB domain-containing protein n=1 Tax=Fundulus heteroclitus TaxID=8078 RepID=A0A3Q2R4N9_FUNHE